MADIKRYEGNIDHLFEHEQGDWVKHSDHEAALAAAVAARDDQWATAIAKYTPFDICKMIADDSYLRMYEDALILLAWESGKLSEGQVSTALETDRISLRIMLCEAIDKGAELGGVLHDHNRKKRRRKEAALDAMGVKK